MRPGEPGVLLRCQVRLLPLGLLAGYLSILGLKASHVLHAETGCGH